MSEKTKSGLEAMFYTILVVFIIPFGIHSLVCLLSPLAMVGDEKDWLIFAGSYISAIASFLMVYLTWKILRHNAKTGYKQQFESTFFQLLNQLSSTRDQILIMYSTNGKITEYKSSIAIIHISKIIFGKLCSSNETLQISELKPIYCEASLKDFGNLIVYVKSLYYLIEYIDNGDFKTKEKEKYIFFVKSQLTNATLQVLLSESILSNEIVGLKQLLKKWDILECLHSEKEDKLMSYLLKEYTSNEK